MVASYDPQFGQEPEAVGGRLRPVEGNVPHVGECGTMPSTERQLEAPPKALFF
jgi:hypothetical protein